MNRIVLASVFALPSLAWGAEPVLRFDLGPGAVLSGYEAVVATTLFSPSRPGFAFGSSVTCTDRGGMDPLRGDFCTGEGPFFFSVSVPEGNYRVTVSLGDAERASVTTIKAESRRLMAHAVRTAAGEWQDVVFTVNVRTPQLPSGDGVRLGGRELNALHWDGELTLEFTDERPAVAGITIERVADAVTVFLAGDSTVTDQSREPYAAWGQMLPLFFGQGVAVANHAESGRTLRAFRSENRLAKIVSQIGEGDLLFIQFAHNDQKPGANHAEPFGDYDDELRFFIRETRARGATPVLVTSVWRRRFDSQGRLFNTLGDYAAAMKAVGRSEDVPVIDLGEGSRILFESLGVDGSKHAFLHHPAGSFPEQKQALEDDTHASAYGAYELSRMVVEGIKRSGLDIARHLRPTPAFDPRHPDPFREWRLPVSPLVASAPAAAAGGLPSPSRAAAPLEPRSGLRPPEIALQ